MANDEERRKRLAEALRANLRRRKSHKLDETPPATPPPVEQD